MADGVARARWIDVTRGFAILFVVMHHAGSYERALFAMPDDRPGGIWLDVELLLYHLRLPLFFFISGALGSGHFSRAGVPRIGAVLTLVRAYWLWGIALTLLVPRWPTDGGAFTLDMWRLLGLAWGTSVAWYLWAIAICFTFAFVTRRIAASLAMIAAIAYGALLQWGMASFDGTIDSLGRCLPLYVLGFRLPALGGWITGQSGFRKVTFPLIVYLSALGATAIIPIPNLILDLGGIVVGLLLVGTVLRHAPNRSAWIEWIGLRTLPIYLIHFPIIATLGCTTIRLMAPLSPYHPLILIYVPLLAAASVTLSLLLHALIVRAGVGWLFAPPPLASLLPRKDGETPVRALIGDRFPMDGSTG